MSPRRRCIIDGSSNMRQWSIGDIQNVLEYCKQEELRVRDAWSKDNSLTATVCRRPLAYTIKPFPYLGLAELAISVAQTSQLLADDYIYTRCPSWHGSLVAARVGGHVHFASFQVHFRRPLAEDYYQLDLSINHCRRNVDVAFALVRFSIVGYLHGKTVCSFPLIGA